jgi:hypothetical protein
LTPGNYRLTFIFEEFEAAWPASEFPKKTATIADIPGCAPSGSSPRGGGH